MYINTEVKLKLENVCAIIQHLNTNGQYSLDQPQSCRVYLSVMKQTKDIKCFMKSKF